MRCLALILLFALTASASAEQRHKASSTEPPAIEEKLSVQQQCQAEHPALLNPFTWADYTVVVSMLVISICIGFFYACFVGKQVSSKDFLLGGSDMGTIPMAMSLAASFITAIELLGNPAEMYAHGTQFWMTCLAFVLVVPIASRLYLPVYMNLRLTSSYEYLNLRFNKHCRLLASSLYMLQMVLYTSVAVYAPALALSRVTGLNVYLAVSLVYVVCIFYASQGGMKAVIMTDTFQAAVLIGSLLLIVFWGASMEGGWQKVWETTKETHRLEFFNLDPNPTVRHSYWSVVIGGTFYWTTMYCSNQATVQKYLSVEKISQVRKALWVSAFGLIFIYTINFATGAVLLSAYEHCDPKRAGQIEGLDQLLPLYVMNYMGKAIGVPGFFVAGIFAASLGTVASAMNSLAAITCEDILGGLFKIDIPAEKGALYAKWISIFFGLLSFALVFVVERLGSVLQVALSFNGMVGGITLGLFSLGMFVPWANAKGAMTGAILSLALVMWIGLGAQIATFNGNIRDDTLPTSIDQCPCLNATTSATAQPVDTEVEEAWFIYRISYLWYSAIGCLGTMLIGVIVSYFTGFQEPAELDYGLLSPPISRLLHPKKPKHHPQLQQQQLQEKPEKPEKKIDSHLQGITNLGLVIDA
ncbi:hypothetical protein TKK_0013540 [Trichogramma kaykai]|uniref:Sodium-coupled monocarboxylate transporter 1 n=1 Tax=Trichogramma kaykai TaxID=54128 RepID=A0ABD2WHX7_9HYME